MRWRISHREWASRGGLMNPRLFRVQRGEIWVHYCTA